ncbi:MAG: hypothetical protein U1B30_12860 [Pseudomonadota bacterium]|nr:hypothetical protein [Pseudomonadota bacterium]
MDYQIWVAIVFLLALVSFCTCVVRRQVQIKRHIFSDKAVFILYIHLHDFQHKISTQKQNNSENTVTLLRQNLATASKDMPVSIYSSIDQLLDKYDEALLLEHLRKNSLYSLVRRNGRDANEMLRCSKDMGLVLQQQRTHLMSSKSADRQFPDLIGNRKFLTIISMRDV